MREAVIVDAVRTPIGRGRSGGALAEVHPVELLGGTLRALVERSGLDAALVDDVIGGCVRQADEQALNVTRHAVLAAGFPHSVPAVTIDRQCGSSQQAAHFAVQGVVAGAYDVVIACGVGSESRAPRGSVARRQDPSDAGVPDRFAPGLIPQGVASELIAREWGLSRRQLDELALRSHQRAAAAVDAGRFDRELVVMVPRELERPCQLVADEGIRRGTSLEGLAALPAAFADERWEQRFGPIEWRTTAGNASQIGDGAAAVLIVEAQLARRLGLRPRARFHSFAVVGDDPVLMLTGIIPATERVLEAAGLTIGDIDAFEVDEAFASVVAAWQAETRAPMDRVNVNGGALALGHPLGAAGARLLTTLVNVLEQRGGRFGLQTMCAAGGLANATVIERL